ncbi:hypothetical protein ACH4F6_04970 [Streptomyces sp. NPDC017936]|uniref:hypothetical protein n=1 Tax=Streptomyces sp. NPDC017936 TaxID=3365016 RepID=UPI0037A50D4F
MTEIDYGLFADRLEHARREGTAARWELLRSFQTEWGYRPSGRQRAADGPDEEQLEGVDPSLPVPAALSEWWNLPYNSFVDRPRWYWTNPEWPPTVRPDPSGYGPAQGLPRDNPFVGADEDLRVCVFMAEYEYCNEWGYPAARSALADPPVLVAAQDDDGADGWQPQSPSVSEFFLHLAVSRLPATLGWTACLNGPTERTEALLRERLTPTGLLPWRELGSRTEYFGGPDVLVGRDTGWGDWDLVAYGRSGRALERLADTLGVTWSEGIGEPEDHGV